MAYHRITSVVDQHLTEDMAKYQLSHGQLSIGYYMNQETKHSIIHSHPFYEYILVKKGIAEYHVNGARFFLRPGEMLLISPDVLHAMHCADAEESYERLILQINAAFMEQVLAACGLEHRIGAMPSLYTLRADSVHYWNLHGLLDRINTASSIEDAALRENLHRSQMMELMLTIEQITRTEQVQPPSASSKLIVNVTAYIQEHFREPELTVARIAQHTYVSREHLSRTFREYTGESISRYLTELRMQEFRHGLLEGKGILNASLESGFSDYSSFVKSFRKLYGITPMDYREQLHTAMDQSKDEDREGLR